MKIVLLTTFMAVVGVYVVAFLLSTTDDRVDQLDTDALRDVAGPACVTMRTEIDALPALPVGATDEERQARLDVQRVAVERFVAQVRTVGDAALDDDEPAREWLGDWEALLQARQDFATAGFTGDFAVPVEGGQPITMRMDDIGVDACQVPTALSTSP